MELDSPDFLKNLEALIDARHQAAVIPERDVATGFWARCKAAERASYSGTKMEAARAVTRDLFTRVGGYDQDISFGEDLFITRLYERETQIARSDSVVLRHHTGDYSLRFLLRKRFNYGKTANVYIRKASLVGAGSAASIVRTSIVAYLRAWPLIFKYPLEYLCVIPLRAMESAAVLLGMRSEPVHPEPFGGRDR
jgi:hypothetical protein